MKCWRNGYEPSSVIPVVHAASAELIRHHKPGSLLAYHNEAFPAQPPLQPGSLSAPVTVRAFNR